MRQGQGEVVRYTRINGRNYVLATYVAELIQRAMEAARYDGLIEGARIRAKSAKQRADALEAAE